MTPFLKIAAYVRDGVALFGLGVISEVFADRSAQGLPGFQLVICADRPGTVRTDSGLSLTVQCGLEAMDETDLVFVLPGENYDTLPSPVFTKAVQAAYGRGAIIAASCVGAHLLAATGLLDGRCAATHWKYAGALAQRYPSVSVNADALYVDEGRIVTGAGVTAAVDLCLHLIRREHGSAPANAIARMMVTPPHREGGQAQYVAAPVAGSPGDSLAEVMSWAQVNLHEPLTVETMAARALMSSRTFARRFKETVGASPHAWLTAQRLQRAEELLETGGLPVDEIARLTGYGSAAALRQQFVRRRGVPPRTYRGTFGRR